MEYLQAPPGTRDMVGPKGLTTEKFVDSAGRTAAGQNRRILRACVRSIFRRSGGGGVFFVFRIDLRELLSFSRRYVRSHRSLITVGPTYFCF